MSHQAVTTKTVTLVKDLNKRSPKRVRTMEQSLDPKIWSELPYDLLESIASFCDIDTRRALGFKPRKIAQKCKLPLGGDMYSAWLWAQTCVIADWEYENYVDIHLCVRPTNLEKRPLWLKDIEALKE